MKIYSLLPVFILLTLSTGKCKKNDTLYKGRLEIKALCMNYTIGLLEGNMDSTRIVAQWKDETTGKTYKDVFALGSACTFPATIEEGDEFYFMIDSSYTSNCAVCMAYYPKPPKSLAIKIVNK